MAQSDKERGSMAGRAKKGLDIQAIIDNAPDGYIVRDISAEALREIVTPSIIGKTPSGKDIIVETVYTIKDPVLQVIREGGVTIRIVDARGMVHLVPGPGYRGANHRWIPRDPSNPVQF